MVWDRALFFGGTDEEIFQKIRQRAVYPVGQRSGGGHRAPFQRPACGALDIQYAECPVAVACGGLIALYLAARAVTLVYYLGRQGVRIALATTPTPLRASASSIPPSPSSSGGQPMQVLAMHRLGIPVSTATATVSVKFIGFQCALLVTGLVFWLAHWDMAGAAGGDALSAGPRLPGQFGADGGGGAHHGAQPLGQPGGKLVRAPAGPAAYRQGPDAAGHRALELLEEYRQALSRLIAHPWSGAGGAGPLLPANLFPDVGAPVLIPGVRPVRLGPGGPVYLAAAVVHRGGLCAPARGGGRSGGRVLPVLPGRIPEGEILAAMLCWRFFTHFSRWPPAWRRWWSMDCAVGCAEEGGTRWRGPIKSPA